MLKKISIAILSMIFTMAMPRPSWAETVIEKVARTGFLTVGTRVDLVPYAYVNDKGQLVGYSIDVLNLIKEQLQQKLGKEVTIQTVVIDNFADRIPRLVNRQIDISCDTAFTWERDEFVDFSESYSISGIRLLVKQNSSLGTPESLAGKQIGIAPHTVAEDVIKRLQPKAKLVQLKSVEEGLTALDKGQVDALAGDSVILDGLRQRLNPKNYKLVPKEPFARYGHACMVPQNDSTFLNLVNYSIVQLMQGYVVGDRRYVDLVGRWFGPQGIIDDIDPGLIRNFFQNIILTREQKVIQFMGVRGLLADHSAKEHHRRFWSNPERKGKRGVVQMKFEQYHLVNRFWQQQQENLQRRSEEQKQDLYAEDNSESQLGQYLDRLLAARIAELAIKWQASSIVIPELGDIRESIECEIQAWAQRKFPKKKELQKQYAKEFRTSFHRWSYGRLARSIRNRAARDGIAIELGRQPRRGTLQEKVVAVVQSAYDMRQA